MRKPARHQSIPKSKSVEPCKKRFYMVFLAAALGAAGIIYGPSLRGDFLWDDDDYVVNNETLRSLGGLGRIWIEPGAVPQYYPLVHTTFWIEYRLWGLAPTGYRIINLLFHVLNAFLLWRVLAALGLRGALPAAGIFLVHPVAVESVAWITERKNVLSLFFYLLSMHICVRLYDLKCMSPDNRQAAGETMGDGEFSRRLYAASLMLHGLALLSKTVACSLPAAVLVLIYWKRGRITRRELLLTAPMFLLGVLLAAITVWMEKEKVGARGPDFAFTLAQRSAIAGQAIWFYLGKLVWPHPLMFVYPRREAEFFGWMAYLALPAAVALAAALWLARRRIGRGPFAAALLFGGTLFPALGFINVYPMIYSYWADHFQYHASIFPIALGCALAAGGFAKRRVPRSASWATAGVILGILALLSWRQAHVYRSLETLWLDTLAKNPDSWLANNNYGNLLLREGECARAVGPLRRAVEARDYDPLLHYNLANALAECGQAEPAERHYRRALELQPDMADVQLNLGNLLADTNRNNEAVECYQTALQLRPRLRNAHNNLGNLLARMGHFEAAAEHYRLELDGHPENALAHGNLANVLTELGRFAEAFAHYEAALRLDPADPQFARNLDLARKRQRRSETPAD